MENSMKSSSYQGPLTLEGYMKKKKMKINLLSGDKTSYKYFKISLEERKFCSKANSSMRQWKKVIDFRTLVRFFPRLEKEDKSICDFTYGFQIITTDKRYILFCKEEETHYSWVRLLEFLFNKKDIGTIDNYRKLIQQNNFSQQPSQKLRSKPTLNSGNQETSVRDKIETNENFDNKLDMKEIFLKDQLNFNVDENDTITISVSKTRTKLLHQGNKTLKSQIENQNNILLERDKSGNKRNSQTPDTSPKKPTSNARKNVNNPMTSYTNQNPINLNISNNNENVISINLKNEESHSKDLTNDLDFESILLGDADRAKNQLIARNSNQNIVQNSGNKVIGNRFGKDEWDVNGMMKQYEDKNEPLNHKNSSNLNKSSKYRYPNNEHRDKNNLAKYLENKNENNLLFREELNNNITPEDKLIFDDQMMHLKKDLFNEKFQIENLHCGIDDDKNENIDKSKNILVGHVPIKIIKKLGMIEEDDVPVHKKYNNDHIKKKHKVTVESYGNLIDNMKMTIQNNGKVLDVNRSIIGENENSWVLNLNIKEKNK